MEIWGDGKENGIVRFRRKILNLPLYFALPLCIITLYSIILGNICRFQTFVYGKTRRFLDNNIFQFEEKLFMKTMDSGTSGPFC